MNCEQLIRYNYKGEQMTVYNHRENNEKQDKALEVYEAWAGSDAGDTMLSTNDPFLIWLSRWAYKEAELIQVKERLERAEETIQECWERDELSDVQWLLNKYLKNNANSLSKL